MRKCKKLFALLLIITMMSTILSACSEANTPESSNTESAAQTQSAEASESPVESQAQPEETKSEETAPPEPDQPEEAEPVTMPASPEPLVLPLANNDVTLSLWYSYPPWLTNFIEIDEKPIFVEIQDILGVNLNITGVSLFAATEQFNIMMASGDYTDLITDFSYDNGMDAAVMDEVVLDLTELIDSYCPNYYSILNSNEDIKKSVTSLEGFIPAFYGINDENGYIKGGHWINTDMLSSVGMDSPKTYDDWYNVLTAFKTELGADAALWTEATGLNTDIMAGYGVTAEMYQIDGKVHFGILEDGFLSYLEMMNKWYSEGLIYQDFYSQVDGADKPDAGLVDEARSGIWRNSANAYNNYSVSAEAVMLPVLSTGDKLHFSEMDGYVTRSNLTITTSCDDPVIAAKWCDYWYSEDGSLMCNYGIENLSYVIGEDGKPEFTELVTNNSEGMTFNNAVALYSLFNCWGYIVDNTKMDLSYNEYQIASRETWADHNDTEWNIPDGVSLTQAETESYNLAYSDIDTFVDENILKFITGEKPLSDFESFKNQIREMGIQDCIDIYQTAVDRYFSS